MSIRETYLKDYGLNGTDADKILSYCRSATGVRSTAYPSGGARGVSGDSAVSIPEPDNRTGI